MNRSTKQLTVTRWRELDDPVSPLDAIEPDALHYEEGRLPTGFVMLLYDGMITDMTNVIKDPRLEKAGT